MNKEYYQAKADLCRNLAINQMVEGEAKEAGANLIRMVNALNQINLINYKDGDYEKTVMCTVMGDKVDALQSVQPGTDIEVSINIESREYNERWYTDVKAWKWEVVGQGQTAANVQSTNDPLPF